MDINRDVISKNNKLAYSELFLEITTRYSVRKSGKRRKKDLKIQEKWPKIDLQRLHRFAYLKDNVEGAELAIDGI